MITRNILRSRRRLLVIATSLCLSSAGLAFANPATTDSDADGINDLFDNCVEHANPSQADLDGDGFGTACDADFDNNSFVNFSDLAYFRSAFGTSDAHADFDSNSFVNFSDLARFRQLFGQSPGPAGQGVFPLTAVNDIGMQNDVSVTTRCNANDVATHFINGELLVSGGTTGDASVEVADIVLTDADGSVVKANTETHFYTITLEDATISAVRQSSIKVDARINGEIVTTNQVLELSGCLPPAAPFDLSNAPQQPGLPPVFGTEEGKPSEVDVIHLGGSPFGPTQTRMVAAAGTGAGARLFSYTMDQSSHAPIYLDQSDSFAGFDIKLHTLSDEVSPDLSIAPFIAASRLDDNLWLRTWQLTSSGSFRHFTGRGYGENAKTRVDAYAITHRLLDDGNYQVVTPIKTDEDQLRLVTWLVERNSGIIIGRYDSTDFGDPDTNPELSVSHLNNGLYLVTYRNSQGRLHNHYWQVSPQGFPSSSGSMASGFNLQGTDTLFRSTQSAINLPILTDDFITPVFFHNPGNIGIDDMRIYTWETRNTGFADPGLIYSPYLISDNSRDQREDLPGVDILPAPTPSSAGGAPPNVRAMLSDDKAGDFNLNDGELFTQLANGELTEVQIASVAKAMVLLVAVEAINNGQVSLDDDVTVSEGAGDVGGSKVGPASGEGLVPDEEQTLELLLHGMMLTSGNDAAAAIAEHIGGSIANFTNLMNIRASQLGMSNTTHWIPDNPFGGPGGGATSTPEDQIKLWRFAREIPLFVQIASETNYFSCGTGPDDEEKCWSITKFNDGGYPGMNGWKGGNGGFFIEAYTTDQNGPYCIGSGCLIAESYRMDRGFIVGIQNSSDRWGDAAELWDYGLRSQFTPDRRGSGQAASGVSDFGLDNIGDLSTATIHISSGEDAVQVCTWSSLVDTALLDQNSCIDLTLEDVAAAINPAIPTKVDGAILGTTFSDGDFITGHIDTSNRLQLELWRVGRF